MCVHVRQARVLAQSVMAGRCSLPRHNSICHPLNRVAARTRARTHTHTHEQEYGASLTMTCNTGFGLSNNENDKFVLPDAPKTRVFACDGFCNTTQSWCKPVLCGNYTAPNGSQATFLSARNPVPAPATDASEEVPAQTPAPTT